MLLLQVENMKDTNHCGSTRGGTRSPERRASCIREDTGRQRKVRTGISVLTSFNWRNSSQIPLYGTGNRSAFGPQAVGRSWLMSTTWTFLRKRMCGFPTFSDHSVPPNVQSHSFDSIMRTDRVGSPLWCFKDIWEDEEMPQMKVPECSWNLQTMPTKHFSEFTKQSLTSWWNSILKNTWLDWQNHKEALKNTKPWCKGQ